MYSFIFNADYDAKEAGCNEPMAATSSATCPSESILSIRLRPDFSVVFEGYAGGAEHCPC